MGQGQFFRLAAQCEEICANRLDASVENSAVGFVFGPRLSFSVGQHGPIFLLSREIPSSYRYKGCTLTLFIRLVKVLPSGIVGEGRMRFNNCHCLLFPAQYLPAGKTARHPEERRSRFPVSAPAN